MKKVQLFFLISLLCTSCLRWNGKNSVTYTNPLFPVGTYPYATFYQGNYYYIMQQAQDTCVVLWKTSDITNVSKATHKIVWLPKDSVNRYHLWSPEIHRIAGKWYIYFEADDGNTDNHQLYVIENDSPDPMQGEFRMKGAIMTNPEWNWGIHPTTFENRGKQYLLWSGWPKRRIDAETQCIYIASMKNPWTLDSKRIMISYPKYEWERQWINPDGMRTAYPIYVNENPECFHSRDHKKIIVYYSASGCWSPYYCEGMLVADVNSNLLNPASWLKSPEPVFTQSPKDSIFGVASVSFTPSPDGTEWYMLYQAKNRQNIKLGVPSLEVNNIRLQKITWDSRGMPILGSPVQLGKSLLKPSGTY